ncbi:hypothetical protein IJH02_00615 [Candidatus Saccharibacteria bacterium]|nr:hypothetical protein [Candidatus Saccharibacteria bacterium]
MKRRLGFTIIEVSLFLAVSALLFVGVAAGAGMNVARQRYNNAVQDYTEFLRRLYSQTEDVQNNLGGNAGNRDKTGCTLASSVVSKNHSGVNTYSSKHNYAIGDQATNTVQDESGRTNCAIYGKIAFFDARIENLNTDEDPNDKIMVYDVIGDVIDIEHKLPEGIEKAANPTLEALRLVHADFLAYETTSNDNLECKVVYAGGEYSYTPDWSSHIENTEKGKYWSGAVMIVRSPVDGTIHTYVLDLNEAGFRLSDPVAADYFAAGSCSNAPSNTTLQNIRASLTQFLDTSDSSVPHFSDKTAANFCVDSGDSYVYNGRRRNVRLKPDGTNSAAVELIEFDSEDNVCVD